MSVELQIMSVDLDLGGDPQTQAFKKNEVFLGRSGENDFILDNPSVSARHAKIRVYSNGGDPLVYLTDLHSTNGIMVGGKRLPPGIEILVSLRERIIIGNCLIRLEVDESESSNVAEAGEPLPEAFAEVDEPKAPIISPGQTKVMTKEEVEASEFYSTPVKELQKEEAKVSSEELKEEEPAPSFESWSTEPSRAEPSAELPEAVLSEDVPAEAEHLGSSDSMVTVFVDGADLDDIDFVATQLFTISGQVLHKGRPLPEVTIVVGDETAGVTADDGSFAFVGVSEGTKIDLRFRKDGYLLEPLEIEFEVVEDRKLTITARQKFSIRGRVIHKGVPLENVAIHNDILGTVRTDAQGVYVFNDVPEGGEYILTAKKDGFRFGPMRARAK